MLGSLLARLGATLLAVYVSHLGWLWFLLLGFLPFAGVAWMGWSAGLVLTAFFADRILALVFLYSVDPVARLTMHQIDRGTFIRSTLVLLVLAYMLLGMGAFVADLTGLLHDPHLTQDLAEIVICSSVLYLLQGLHLLRLRSANLRSANLPRAVDTSGRFLPMAGLLTLQAMFLFMASFAGGMFLRETVAGTFLGSFFDSGYGIVLFLLVTLRLIGDYIWFRIGGFFADGSDLG